MIVLKRRFRRLHPIPVVNCSRAVPQVVVLLLPLQHKDRPLSPQMCFSTDDEVCRLLQSLDKSQEHDGRVDK